LSFLFRISHFCDKL
ncbi:hypothetical protein Trydic_g15445, partial [Trypoxylus dichotomus]